MTYDFALNDQSNAVLIYSPSSDYQVHAKEGTVGGSWADASTAVLSRGSNQTDIFQVSMNSTGQVLATWVQDDAGSVRQIFKAERIAGTWSIPANTNDSVTGHTYQIDMHQHALSDTGQAVIVWYQSNGPNHLIFKAERSATNSGTWNSFPTDINDAANLISMTSAETDHPTVAINGNGDVVAAFQQNDGTFHRILKTTRTGGTWTRPTSFAKALSSPNIKGMNPRVAINGSGDAVIMWEQDAQFFKATRTSGTWTLPADASHSVFYSSSKPLFGTALTTPILRDSGELLYGFYTWDLGPTVNRSN